MGAGAFQKVGSADLVNGKVPTNFRGICVDLSGTRAPVFGASDTQVNFQVPQNVSSGDVMLQVTEDGYAANSGLLTVAH